MIHGTWELDEEEEEEEVEVGKGGVGITVEALAAEAVAAAGGTRHVTETTMRHAFIATKTQCVKMQP